MLQVSLLFALAGVYMGDRQRFVDCNAQGKSESLFQYLLLEIALFSLDSLNSLCETGRCYWFEVLNFSTVRDSSVGISLLQFFFFIRA